jgi:hypothetical protein
MIFEYLIKPKPNQMKRLSFIFIFLVLLLSCEKKDNTCNCDNPLEELSWLKELKVSFTNCSCQISIIQATYQKQTVFYPIMNDPLCNSYQIIVLYDCSGTTIKTYTLTDHTFGDEVTGRKTIYTCKTKK